MPSAVSCTRSSICTFLRSVRLFSLVVVLVFFFPFYLCISFLWTCISFFSLSLLKTSCLSPSIWAQLSLLKLCRFYLDVSAQLKLYTKVRCCCFCCCCCCYCCFVATRTKLRATGTFMYLYFPILLRVTIVDSPEAVVWSFSWLCSSTSLACPWVSSLPCSSVFSLSPSPSLAVSILSVLYDGSMESCFRRAHGWELLPK